ncbi:MULTISPECIES: universal stress protein [unclassified Microbacterium]|uniref:universal stress protein n=1 Tax=unclassified Microbacterium TaxID=2609290 RepID=UPI00097F1D5F|nr:universal stress protein [Microbacterium sp. JB110]RCS60558.1 universal stress protein [Microbacterium sp. JB110]SJM64967.1 Universal stress protein family [Frigoribacterium sp. JB110]
MNGKSFSASTGPSGADSSAQDLGVLVGFDGSENAALALDYAADEAHRRNVVLTVVTVYTIPVRFYANLASMPAHPDAVTAREEALEILDAARGRLADYVGEIVYRAEAGHAVGVLAELTESARVLVVGMRGRGGFLGHVLGSVAVAIPAHASCPTIVVGDQPVPHGPVTAAVDGSDASQGVLAEAADVASSRGAVLDVVMVLPPSDYVFVWYPEAAVDSDVVEARRMGLEERLRDRVVPLREDFPDLTIETTVAMGPPRPLLADRTAGSQLTVMGTHGRGAVMSTLLGSVSRSVLHHSHAPIMVVPA